MELFTDKTQTVLNGKTLTNININNLFMSDILLNTHTHTHTTTCSPARPRLEKDAKIKLISDKQAFYCQIAKKSRIPQCPSHRGIPVLTRL